jgi:hypothetical protein
MGHSFAEEVSGAALLAGRGLAATTEAVRETHRAVAGRVFGPLGPLGAPARMGHEAISRAVYAAVGGSAWAAATIGGRLAGRLPGSAGPLSDDPRGNVAVGALNGAFGDHLSASGNPLALPMTVRNRGHDVELTRPALATAFPAASGKLVVFLPGLCETELAWQRDAVRHWGDAASTHGSRLAAEAGLTPVYLRYNTGLHISQNGALLSALLEALLAAWPVDVDSLALVGHSMGGLVARSACGAGSAGAASWPARLRQMVYLGSPHLGAPLELAATAAGCALRVLPETRPLARALAARSVGIKDLRFGAVIESDWAGSDPDAWRAEPTQICPLADGVAHYYIGATMTRDPRHPAARVFGDLLVTFPSASGAGRRRSLGFPVDAGRHFGSLHHFDLLNHPLVYRALLDWLAPGHRGQPERTQHPVAVAGIRPGRR